MQAYKALTTCSRNDRIINELEAELILRFQFDRYAGMMELADMQDLGSCAEMRWGSSPHTRTTTSPLIL